MICVHIYLRLRLHAQIDETDEIDTEEARHTHTYAHTYRKEEG